MHTALLDSLQPPVTDKTPQVEIGDIVRVHQRITEGRSERIQVFEGVVISSSGGKSTGATYTAHLSVAQHKRCQSGRST